MGKGRKPSKRKLVAKSKKCAFTCEKCTLHAGEFNYVGKDCEVHSCVVGPNNSSSGKINFPQDWVGDSVIVVRPIPKTTR